MVHNFVMYPKCKYYNITIVQYLHLGFTSYYHGIVKSIEALRYQNIEFQLSGGHQDFCKQGMNLGNTHIQFKTQANFQPFFDTCPTLVNR